MALPIATFGTSTTAIGADFVTLGLTPGITVHLDDEWAVGLVPIVVVPFKLGERVSWFLELDLPFFLRDGGTKVNADLSIQLQSAFAF